MSVAGILADTLSDGAAVVVAVTGVFGGASRYAAVLAQWEKDKDTGGMMVKAALFSAPAVAMAITVLLLNWAEAGPGLAVAALTLVAAGGGILFGVFADHLPEFSGKRRRDDLIARHLDHLP